MFRHAKLLHFNAKTRALIPRFQNFFQNAKSRSRCLTIAFLAPNLAIFLKLSSRSPSEEIIPNGARNGRHIPSFHPVQSRKKIYYNYTSRSRVSNPRLQHDNLPI